MFTGLIQKTGRVVDLQHGHSGGSLSVRASAWNTAVEKGESIAISGVCLTVADMAGGLLRFDVLGETLRRTNLGGKTPEDFVNLERALRVGDAFGGHLVTGHVDGTGRIEAIEQTGRDWAVRVSCDDILLAGMVVKGSIALDGISLTLVNVEPSFFTVHIIPHTWAETSLATARPGDRVNLETDLIGKYVARYLATAKKTEGLRLEQLRDAGFTEA